MHQSVGQKCYPKAQDAQFENIHSISPAHVQSSCYSLMLCFNYVKSPLKFIRLKFPEKIE